MQLFNLRKVEKKYPITPFCYINTSVACQPSSEQLPPTADKNKYPQPENMQSERPWKTQP